MYAIVRTGGKQYTVRENDVIKVEKLDKPEGKKVVFSDVLFISGEKGEMIGTPLVEGATVTGRVIQHVLGEKVIGFTYKRRKNKQRRYGHRQQFTQVSIEKISVKKPRARKRDADSVSEGLQGEERVQEVQEQG